MVRIISNGSMLETLQAWSDDRLTWERAAYVVDNAHEDVHGRDPREKQIIADLLASFIAVSIYRALEDDPENQASVRVHDAQYRGDSMILCSIELWEIPDDCGLWAHLLFDGSGGNRIDTWYSDDNADEELIAYAGTVESDSFPISRAGEAVVQVLERVRKAWEENTNAA